MPLVKVKPTSAGRRALVKVVNPALHKGGRSTRSPRARSAARGATTTATSPRATAAAATSTTTGSSTSSATRTASRRGGAARVRPNRSAHIALLLYRDGERRYIIAPRGVAVGGELMSGADAPIKAAHAAAAQHPVGTTIHCIEMKPGAGAQLARSAAPRCSSSRARAVRAAAPALRRDPQGARRLPRHDRRGRQRGAQPALDRRPARTAGAAGVRRCAPGDEPGRPPDGGRTNGGGHRLAVGTPAKGYKTRKNKRTDVMIVRRRHAQKG